MTLRGWYLVVVPGLAWSCWLFGAGCESSTANKAQVAREPGGRARAVAAAGLAEEATSAPKPPERVPAELVRPSESEPGLSMNDVTRQVPDPADLPDLLARQLEARFAEIDANARLTPQQKEQQKAERKTENERRMPAILERLKAIHRPEQVRLSLGEAIRRTLHNNYTIQAQSYGPAIEGTRIVEAEAQFDAAFFTSFTNNKQDRPSSSQLQGTMYQLRDFNAGIRKLLSAGTQVQVSYALNRTQTDLVYQTLNPSYFNNFNVEFRQPFLRGFGLDFNRSQIELAKLGREVSIERFRENLREGLYNIEQAYWQLLLARRAISVQSELLADLEIVLHYLEQRVKAGYDVFRVQLGLPASEVEQRKAEFIELCNNVRNAEDALKRAMNDPDLNLARDVEIVPADVPAIEPIVLDRVGEVATALQKRSELHEAKLSIEQAKVGIGVAKNQALPRLDATFRYIVDGLGDNPDSAFTQLSENRFQEYFIMVEFEWPIGNRGAEAGLRRARFQQAQAVAMHRDTIERVILEVQQAVRNVGNKYDQIGPWYRATMASREWADVVKARQERKDSLSLQQELDSYKALADSRKQLIYALVNYNIALVDLERQKDTLLEHNNIVIEPSPDDSYLDPVRPIGP